MAFHKWLYLLVVLLSSSLLAACAGQLNKDNSQSSESVTQAAPAPGKRPITLGGDPEPQGPARPPLEWVESLTYTANGPFPVYLPDIPTAVYDPLNKLARGWGLTDTKRITKRISKEEADRLRAEALLLPPDPNVQNLTVAQPQARAPAAGIGFDSLDISDCCGGGANVPPDPELAVGPNHIIAVVNVAFAIYDKAGVLLSGPTTFSSFFAGTTGCSNTAVFDPNVLYDEESDRFILGIDGNGTDYCVAATASPDPNGTWNRYGFATDFGGAFFDYPHAGVGVDAIYMGANLFSGLFFFEGRVYAMDKNALYNGAALTVVSQSTGTDGTPQPMNLHGFNQGTWPASGPHYLMTEVFDGANHSVWSWNDPFGINAFVKTADLNLNTATGVAAGFPVDAPQSGSTARIQANDWRGLDTEYRNGFIWMTNTIACNPGAGTVDCLRWAKIDPTIPTVVDAGVAGTNGDYRFFPDLAVNHCEDMAIGYTKTSAAMFPSVWVTGRQASDPAGQLQAETELKAGEVAYAAFDIAPHRWGDYTGMTIDPDGKTFWYLGEYSKNTANANGRWGTYIGSFNFSCSGVALVLDPPVPGTAGVLNEWNVSGASANGGVGLTFGKSPGSTEIAVPGCPGLSVDIDNAVIIDKQQADGNGDGLFSRSVPAGFSGNTAYFQAIDRVSCTVSSVVPHPFP